MPSNIWYRSIFLHLLSNLLIPRYHTTLWVVSSLSPPSFPPSHERSSKWDSSATTAPQRAVRFQAKRTTDRRRRRRQGKGGGGGGGPNKRNGGEERYEALRADFNLTHLARQQILPGRSGGGEREATWMISSDGKLPSAAAGLSAR